jgi:hypothetical protein
MMHLGLSEPDCPCGMNLISNKFTSGYRKIVFVGFFEFIGFVGLMKGLYAKGKTGNPIQLNKHNKPK